jgi:sulfur relay (sulfurtransferase) complex TusBCD TusD component (DsrE family)
MSDYLLIASRDPFEHNDAGHYLDLASNLAAKGHQVTVFLVQNAVLAARPCAHSPRLKTLREAGVTVLADDFSLKERGIATTRLVPHVSPSPIDAVVDRLAAGHKTLWN